MTDGRGMHTVLWGIWCTHAFPSLKQQPVFRMMYLFTTVTHPHGRWQLQELLGNCYRMYSMHTLGGQSAPFLSGANASNKTQNRANISMFVAFTYAEKQEECTWSTPVWYCHHGTLHEPMLTTGMHWCFDFANVSVRSPQNFLHIWSKLSFSGSKHSKHGISNSVKKYTGMNAYVYEQCTTPTNQEPRGCHS